MIRETPQLPLHAAPAQTGFSTLEQAVFYHLCHTGEELMGAVQKELQPRGLSCGQYNAMRLIATAGDDPPTCGQLAGMLKLQGSDLTRLLDRLERAGWVERVRSESDRRVVKALLTGEGWKLMDSLEEPLAEIYRGSLAHMSSEQLEQFLYLLQLAVAPPVHRKE